MFLCRRHVGVGILIAGGLLSIPAITLARGGGGRGGHSGGGHSSSHSSGSSSSHSHYGSSKSGSSGGPTHVHGYTKKNGTYVAPHERSKSDGNFSNNWSTKGNVNPFTGKAGTQTAPHGSS